MSTITTAPRPLRSTRSAATVTRPQRQRSTRTRLGRYTDRENRSAREIVRVALADGSALVVDRCASTRTDSRLIAHLAPEEPPENAMILSNIYLADDSRGRCRRLVPADLELACHDTTRTTDDGKQASLRASSFRDAEGSVYRVRALATEGCSLLELRWTRSHAHHHQEDTFDFEVLTLREVIAHVEDYEPARTITTQTLTDHHEDDQISSRILQRELQRMSTSSLLLNRGLREAIQREITREEITMSEIAKRCGRFYGNSGNHPKGDAGWLKRRIGLLPDSPSKKPTPWVHTDVLALIARDGLNVNPHEVEL